MALPQEKTNILHGKLSRIFDNATTLDEFSRRRYEREISAIKKIHYSRGIALEALLAAIDNDVEKVLTLAEEYIALDSTEGTGLLNFAVLLRGLGKVIEAYAILTAGFQKFPLDAALSYELMTYALSLDDEKVINELTSKFPERFNDFRLDFDSTAEETPDEQIVHLLHESVGQGATVLPFSVREKRRIEALLDGVEAE